MFVFAFRIEWAERRFDFACRSHTPLNDISNREELRRPCRAWIIPNLFRSPFPNDIAIMQQQNTICDGEGLLLVMGYIDRRDPCLLQNIAQFVEQVLLERAV